MPAPTDLNSQIALRKGWTWDEQGESVTYQVGIMWADDIAHWQDPEGRWAMGVPDYVGTLEGVAGMLRELNELRDQSGDRRWFWWSYSPYLNEYQCGTELFRLFPILARSNKDRPGDCVGDAWLSEHGKEVVDASSE